MKFISELGGEKIRLIHENIPLDQVKEVKAAIAYASDSPPLLKWSWDNQVKLSFWCRFDYSVPVSTSILKQFLQRNSFRYRCFLTTDFFHPKVIWFVGYGLYIGSANLTDRAWNHNIEAGLFLSQLELENNGVLENIEDFFEELEEYSSELNQTALEYLEEAEKHQNKLYKAQLDLESGFKMKSPLKIHRPAIVVSKVSAEEKRRDRFLEKWNAALAIIEKISSITGNPSNFPQWIPSDASAGVVVDQFLHDFYYRVTRDQGHANHYLVDEFHEKNRTRVPQALEDAVADWKSLPKAHTQEDIFINVRAPLLKDYLSQSKILTLTETEFVELCLAFHAFWDVAKYIEAEEIGLDPNLSYEQKFKADKLARRLYKDRSPNGMDIRQILHFILYSGSTSQVPNRLWEVLNNRAYKIPDFGKGCYGELIGWAMPERFPPINGRTVKALRALGHNIKLNL